MRKVIALLIMMAAVGFYSFHIMNVGSDKKDTESSQVTANDSVEEKLNKYEEEIQNNYPDTPTKVMQLYNRLLDIAYSGQMTDEETGQYVKVVRMLYSDAFAGLNPEEVQLEGLLADLENNKKQDAHIVVSTVGEVYVLQDEKGEQTEAAVTVEHAMNHSGVQRQYLLVKENGKWKINGWESRE